MWLITYQETAYESGPGVYRRDEPVLKNAIIKESPAE